MAIYPIHPSQTLHGFLNRFPALDTSYLTPRILTRIKLVTAQDLIAIDYLGAEQIALLSQGKLLSSTNEKGKSVMLRFGEMLLPNHAHKDNLPSVLSCHPKVLDDPTNHFVWFGAVTPWGYEGSMRRAVALRQPYAVIKLAERTSNLRLATALMTTNYKSRCMCGTTLCFNPLHWYLDVEALRVRQLKAPLAPMKPDFEANMNAALKIFE